MKELWLIQFLNVMSPTIAAIVAAGIKIAVWIIPVLLLVMIFQKQNPLSYLGLTDNFKKGLKWALWITLAMTIYFIISSIVLDLEFSLNLGLDFWLNSFIFVGLTEEIVFRGYVLKKLMTRCKFWKANVGTSLLFVSIHFPVWIYDGLFYFPYVFGAVIQVFIISISFGFIYKKTHSLWSVIIIHSMYGLLVSISN